MSLNKLEILLKSNEVELFKSTFKRLNSHQEEILLGKCFQAGNCELIDFMLTKINPTDSAMANYFIECLSKPIRLTTAQYFNNIKELGSCFDMYAAQRFILYQDKSLFDWFTEQYPVLAFTHAKNFISTAIKLSKTEYLTIYDSMNFDMPTNFFLMQQCYKDKQEEYIEKFFLNQIKNKPDFFTNLQNFVRQQEKKFLLKKLQTPNNPKIIKEEKFFLFANQLLIKLFAKHLDSSLVINNEKIKIKKI